MAEIKTKHILKVSPEQWSIVDEYQGKKQTKIEVGIKVAGSKGPEDMILQTGSEKLLKAIVPGVEVHGYCFPGDKSEKYKTLWRLSAMAKNNEHLVPSQGGFGSGGGGGQQPRGGANAGGGYNRAGYTLDELVGLFQDVHGAVCEAVGEVSDDALSVYVVHLFDKAVECGAKVGIPEDKASHPADGPAFGNEDAPPMDEPPMEEGDTDSLPF